MDHEHVYVWDADMGTHHDIARRIGLDWGKVGLRFGLFFMTTEGTDVHGDAMPPIATASGLHLNATSHIVVRWRDTPSFANLLNAFGCDPFDL